MTEGDMRQYMAKVESDQIMEWKNLEETWETFEEVLNNAVKKSSVTSETILTTKIEKLSFYEKHPQNKLFQHYVEWLSPVCGISYLTRMSETILTTFFYDINMSNHPILIVWFSILLLCFDEHAKQS